jgi:hypothetical protein
VFDRSLVLFALKSLLAALLAAILILGLRYPLRPPQTTAGNFWYLCLLCGAGGLVFFAILAATRAIRVDRLAADLMWTRE